MDERAMIRGTYVDPEMKRATDDHAKAILKQFYKDLQAWINAGFPVHPSFRIENAMCSQLMAYTKNEGYIRDVTCEALKREFREAGLCPIYPFNPVSKKENSKGLTFDKEFIYKTFYSNKARLKWIWEHSK